MEREQCMKMNFKLLLLCKIILRPGSYATLVSQPDYYTIPSDSSMNAGFKDSLHLVYITLSVESIQGHDLEQPLKSHRDIAMLT